MKIYPDACCLNRPFDDQRQERIRSESEAILIILNRLHIGEWEWIGSEALEIEIENTPNIERKNYLTKLLSHVHKSVKIQKKEIRRANQLKEIGFKPFDATHIACSESGRSDIFLTTDDKLLKLSRRMRTELNVNVANPLSWFMEVI
jgi:hypothetical protein